MRTGPVLLLVLTAAWAAARAQVTCEQFGALAQETVQLRDRGASLKRLLADAERDEMKGRYTAQELALIRDVIRVSFDGTLSPAEVVEACKQGGTLIPSR